MPKHGPRLYHSSRRFRNVNDALGTVRIAIALVLPRENKAVRGNVTRSIRVRHTRVSEVIKAIEALVTERFGRAPVEAASAASETVD